MVVKYSKWCQIVRVRGGKLGLIYCENHVEFLIFSGHLPLLPLPYWHCDTGSSLHQQQWCMFVASLQWMQMCVCLSVCVIRAAVVFRRHRRVQSTMVTTQSHSSVSLSASSGSISERPKSAGCRTCLPTAGPSPDRRSSHSDGSGIPV